MNVFKLLVICLTLSACSGFPERPQGYVYAVNTNLSIGHEFEAPKNIKAPFEYTGKDKSLKDMDKYFCVSPEYLVKLKSWIKDVVEYSKDKCK